MRMPVLAIHGGCGVPPMGSLSGAQERHAREGLKDALRAGWSVLKDGGVALDAVEAAVIALEEHTAFNAGRGAVFNADGKHEMDAAIMDGRDLKAGAVGGVARIRNPIRAARAVMERTDHVLLIGEGAETLAARAGLEMVAPDWFSTEERRASLLQMKALQAGGDASQASERLKHGTVGAVAIDRAGHLAAATSTGGYTNKLPGRVGDTPLIGAGTYANDATLAYSGTGKGEIFMRSVLGHELHARMAYKGERLTDACDAMVFGELKRLGGGAGLIAVGRDGTVTLPFNTAGMYRGVASEGEGWVSIYDEREAL
ncbi:MAG: isoaspartyl peptidase/L-asparaginase [Alphaproteobacteria bacterium]|nr:isoaspartyl peptidase/L-asparaginase [Alphaproteobacteria bacterium]MCW5740582.1 isoaspartyl peptidase/L-asparaginase [Alphaproteobacteria bacterium]